jgi:hypothetical protein
VTSRAFLLLTLAVASAPASASGFAPGDLARAPAGAMCAIPAGPEYYAFPLTATGNVPGTGYARGRAEIAVPGTSPFPVALAADGSYVYDVQVAIDNMRAPRSGTLVAWVTTPDLDRVERIGSLDETLRASGAVSWNKFIVVVTLEPGDDPEAATWSGPIVFRGMSRSGAMHTMVGHGALQQENCTAYGYGG